MYDQVVDCSVALAVNVLLQVFYFRTPLPPFLHNEAILLTTQLLSQHLSEFRQGLLLIDLQREVVLEVVKLVDFLVFGVIELDLDYILVLFELHFPRPVIRI